jgi:D-alanyl-D-alanine carboxypeptidase/D-alanyl-D-alanine-endopeptidase (penicillin-binding protein 4)
VRRAAPPSVTAARRVVGTLACAVLLIQVVGAGTALAVGGAIDIASSARVVAFGEPVTISGTLTSGEGCVRGRPLALEWRGTDVGTSTTVAWGSAGADGTFAFTTAGPHSGSYRVTAPADGPCDTVSSAEVLVRVRARITLTAGRAIAGACTDLSVSVEPPKPLQVVTLERWVDGAWASLGSLTLDAGSIASAHPCFVWEDVGVVRLRVRWPAQDGLNADGARVARLRVEPARWMERIEELVAGRAVSISVGEAGAFLYARTPETPRTPASNEKLLLSMALLDAFGPDFRMRTIAASAAPPVDGRIEGDLWILGRGDPEVDGGTVGALAERLVDLGVRRIDGRVLGATTYFRRDWDAHGWNDVARTYVARPTALTFEGNLDERGRHARSPETRAATALAEALRDLGVRVGGRPGAGRPPTGLDALAAVRSRTLQALLAKLLRPSDNFYAEVLGKRLAVEATGAPGSIEQAAAALDGWVTDHGVDGFDLHDASGLSYANRVTTQGIVRLLWEAEAASWGPDLLGALPTGGQGTLRDRLRSLPVRAKTGTLTGISALSGWVRLERTGTWAEFSILSSGMPKWVAVTLEDRIVRLVQRGASWTPQG